MGKISEHEGELVEQGLLMPGQRLQNPKTLFLIGHAEDEPSDASSDMVNSCCEKLEKGREEARAQQHN